MKKLFSFLFKAALCLLIVYIGVRIGNDIIAYVNPWEGEQPVELTDVGSPYKHYYDRLSDIEKHAYNEMLTNIYDMPEKIRLPEINAEQLNKVFSALLCDNPDLFFVGRKCVLSSAMFTTECSVEYTLSKEEHVRQKAEFDKKCEEVLNSLSQPDDDWQTEREIHDYIVKNCEYKIVEDELVYSSSYGALVNGEAACEGYSKAAKQLLDMAGIESAVISGISGVEDSEGPHMWNVVNVYGDYYHLDCTWDDPVNDDGRQVKTYAYFNLSDEMIEATHSDFSYDFDCTATKANYYEKTGSYFASYDRSCEGDVVEVIAKALESGEEFFELRFGSKKVYNNAVSDLIDGGRMYNILRRVKEKTNVDFAMNKLAYFKDSGQYLLTFVIDTN